MVVAETSHAYEMVNHGIDLKVIKESQHTQLEAPRCLDFTLTKYENTVKLIKDNIFCISFNIIFIGTILCNFVIILLPTKRIQESQWTWFRQTLNCLTLRNLMTIQTILNHSLSV